MIRGTCNFSIQSGVICIQNNFIFKIIPHIRSINFVSWCVFDLLPEQIHTGIIFSSVSTSVLSFPKYSSIISFLKLFYFFFSLLRVACRSWDQGFLFLGNRDNCYQATSFVDRGRLPWWAPAGVLCSKFVLAEAPLQQRVLEKICLYAKNSIFCVVAVSLFVLSPGLPSLNQRARNC